MSLLEVPVATAAKALATFVAEHPHADFEVHDVDLQNVEAVLDQRTRAVDKPTKRNSHVRKLTFSSMTTLINAKHSMIPMCIFELVMGPRTVASNAEGVTNTRFHACIHARCRSYLVPMG